MPSLRRFILLTTAAFALPALVGVVVVSETMPLSFVQLRALQTIAAVGVPVMLAADVGALLLLLAPFRKALATASTLGAPERRRAAIQALRLPARAAFIVLGNAVLFIAALAGGVLREGAPADVVVAGVGAGVAFAIAAGMLVYSAAAVTLAAPLESLGPVDLDERGTFRAKILAVGAGLVTVGALLVVSLGYVRYRADSERVHLAAAGGAVDLAAQVLEKHGAAAALDVARGGLDSPAVLFDRAGAVVARSGNAPLPDGLSATGPQLEPARGGWILRRRSAAGTLATFVSDAPLVTARHEAWAQAGALFALLLVFAGALVWSAAGALTLPVGTLNRAADRMTKGDLTVSPPSLTRDEMGQLAAAFRRMAAGLAGLVRDVAGAASGVREGAREMEQIGARVRSGAIEEHGRLVTMSEAVEAMQGSVSLVGRGVETLADYVASTSAAVGEMAAALDEVRRQGLELERLMDSANTDVERLSQTGRRAQTQLAGLDDLASHAGGSLDAVNASLAGLQSAADDSQVTAQAMSELAEASGVVVEEAVAGIESLRQAVDDAKRRVTALGRRSDDIDQILDFIGEVAGRTNLLSLNASIIATQAGEHGKAFGVVADQIRELAAQIASSTNSIGDIIRAVRDDVSGTARLIDRGDALAANGVALTRKSLAALHEIRGATTRARQTSLAIHSAVQAHARSSGAVADLVNSVAANSRGVSEAIHMVGKSVGAVGSVSRGVALLADRVSRALEEQSGLGRRQLEALERINGMLSEITRAVEAHEGANRKVRDLLAYLTRTAAAHEAAVGELSGVADRLGGRSRALAERVDRFKI